MSLRIVVPGRTTVESSPLTSEGSPQSAARKPKVRKRTRTIESEDEVFEHHDHGRGSFIPSSTAGPSNFRMGLSFAEQEIIIDVTGHSQDEAAHHDATAQNPKNSHRTSQFKVKTKTDGPPKKKKSKKSIASDAEFTEEELHDSEILRYDSEDVSDASDEYSMPKGKGKGNVAGRSSHKGVKRKAFTKTELKAKDESRPLPAKGPRAKPVLQKDEQNIEVVGGQPPFPPDSMISQPSTSPMVVNDQDTPPVAKRRKLPTIKKNKLVPSSGPNTPSSATLAPKVAATAVGAKAVPVSETKGSTPGARLPAHVGIADVDLTNRNIYDQLFKGAGGTTPASNRRAKEEERRRELDKMRDEAKAKREAEATHSFDLQAQYEKISRFEEKLKAVRSNALFPNFLAAKWKEQWERNKYKEQVLQESRNSNADEREEGEMT